MAEPIAKKEKLFFLANDIIEKKELKNLNNEFVIEKIHAFLEKHKKINDKFENSRYDEFKRSKEYKEIIKKIRSGLREIYGVFILNDYDKRNMLLQELKSNGSLENHNKILALHKSSKERLAYYPIIYRKIFEIAGKPEKIIDLACGLNPFSYIYIANLGLNPEYNPEYIACDLSEKDLELIKEYFEYFKIKGFAKRIDLVKENNQLAELSKGTDIAFLFKTLDSVETVERNVSKKILENLKSSFITVSFSTKSLGGKKPIRKQKRAWFEKLAGQLGFNIGFFEIPGEIFYVLSKKS